ncbi:MAG: AI-2E family transporter [Sedimentisphaerales bacterium]|nr:AI-2E family transporter [Sedimentisphaerales bacterium]
MPDIQKENMWLIEGSLAVVAVVAAAVVLRYTRVVMIPFVLAIFIFLLVSPILDFQVIRLKIPRALAVALSLLVVLFIIVVLCVLIVLAVQTIVATIGRYSDSFANLAEKIFGKMDSWGIDLNQDKIVQDLRDNIPKFVTDALSRVFGLVSSLFFVLIFVAFLLAGRNPHAIRSGVYADIDQKVRRYIGTKIAISAVTGLVVWWFLAMVGLQLAGVFGMLAFLLNFIPSIGSIISTLLPIPVAVAQFQNVWFVVLVVSVPGLVQTIIGNVIEPKVMGKGLNLHPVIVLLALSFWGLLWGVAGMFLATPMTATIRIVLMQFDTLKPIGNLLAGHLPGSIDSHAV